MQHGVYITEFEKVLFKRDFAISHNSLADLARQVDFSKLKDFSEPDRLAFYEALTDSIANQPRGVEGGIQILGENDANAIVMAMSYKAAQRSFASSRIRNIWCMIFIGGCP
jgi:hypothetical protein